MTSIDRLWILKIMNKLWRIRKVSFYRGNELRSHFCSWWWRQRRFDKVSEGRIPQSITSFRNIPRNATWRAIVSNHRVIFYFHTLRALSSIGSLWIIVLIRQFPCSAFVSMSSMTITDFLNEIHWSESASTAKAIIELTWLIVSRNVVSSICWKNFNVY